MNTNPNAMKVLCFGDSNTYGRNPSNGLRYDAEKRWTGQLQRFLGDDYYLIEEGLGGRTTNVDEDGDPLRNGFAYYKPCVMSHEPDIVVLMLGTNDLKDSFERSPNDIANAIEEYVTHTRSIFSGTKFVIISPTSIDVHATNFEKYADRFSEYAVSKAQTLSELLEQKAEKLDAVFIDAAKVVKLGEEGVHWQEESHTDFAKILAKKIRQEL